MVLPIGIGRVNDPTIYFWPALFLPSLRLDCLFVSWGTSMGLRLSFHRISFSVNWEQGRLLNGMHKKQALCCLQHVLVQQEMPRQFFTHGYCSSFSIWKFHRTSLLSLILHCVSRYMSRGIQVNSTTGIYQSHGRTLHQTGFLLQMHTCQLILTRLHQTVHQITPHWWNALVPNGLQLLNVWWTKHWDGLTQLILTDALWPLCVHHTKDAANLERFFVSHHVTGWNLTDMVGTCLQVRYLKFAHG